MKTHRLLAIVVTHDVEILGVHQLADERWRARAATSPTIRDCCPPGRQFHTGLGATAPSARYRSCDWPTPVWRLAQSTGVCNQRSMASWLISCGLLNTTHSAIPFRPHPWRPMRLAVDHRRQTGHCPCPARHAAIPLLTRAPAGNSRASCSATPANAPCAGEAQGSFEGSGAAGQGCVHLHAYCL